jgi:serine/threonine protein kinase/tetratricopeptide (TPR) repeat protein
MGNSKAMAVSTNASQRLAMTPERWQHVKGVLASVLESDPGERSTYLDRVCEGDPFLRADVENLLAANHLLESGFLNVPPIPVSGPDDSKASVRVGRRIGPYQLVEEIGVGGMGEVYRAFRADDQYRQQVAIKLVRAGHDSSFVVSRFKNERQILAGIEHPNIARLLDGGTTEDGVPYFAMELIEGDPIDEYCARNRLSTTERLKLFLQVCSAVQYAHQRLIIHRDIKPGNILVTSEGVPRLLDFGIAKILETDGSSGQFEATLTIFRALTPAYASPEQVRGEAITTASDVYSLGVVLYELLTGHHPYRRAESTPEELARAVCDAEPMRPSSVVRRTMSLDDTGPSLSGHSSVEPIEGSTQKLSKRLRGDLDNILLMALRKESQRRYASVEQFSGDIRRHLENLPVVARKDTARYRMSKFVARHKVGVAATIVVALTLAIAIIVTGYEARIAKHRFEDLRTLAGSLIFDVHDAIRDLPGSTPARKLIVAKALKYLDSLAKDAQRDPSLQRELAAGYRRIGEVDAGNLGDPRGALTSYQKAIAIRQSLLNSREASVDDLVEFAETSRLAIKVSLSIGAPHPTGLETLQHLAQMLEQGLALHPNHLDVIRTLSRNYAQQVALLSGGFGLSHLGNIPAAVQPGRRGLELTEQLCALQPTNLDFRRDLAASLGSMGDLLYATGQEEEAWQDYLRAQKILEGLAAESPTPKVLLALYDSHYRLIPIKVTRRDLAGATSDARSALDIASKLSLADPQNTMPRLLLAAAYADLSETMSREKKRDETNSAIANAMQVDSELVKNHPKSPEFREMQAMRFEIAGADYLKLGEPTKALQFYQEALVMFSERQRQDPADVGNRHYLAAIYNGIGWTLAQLHRPSEAEESHKKALSLSEPDATSGRSDQEALYRIADGYSGLGDDEQLLAKQAAQSKREQIQHLKNSSTYYQRSLNVWSKIERPKILSPEGEDCLPPAIVSQRLKRVEFLLRQQHA